MIDLADDDRLWRELDRKRREAAMTPQDRAREAAEVIKARPVKRKAAPAPKAVPPKAAPPAPAPKAAPAAPALPRGAMVLMPREAQAVRNLLIRAADAGWLR